MGRNTVLLDCGASSLIAMKAANVDPGTVEITASAGERRAGTVDGIVITHLHGDHFAGVPFLILDGQFSRRRRKLTIAGPVGVRARVEAAMEILFPGSTSVARPFEIQWRELKPRHAITVAGFSVNSFEVIPASGAPALALRLSADTTTIAYSGDTEWTDELIAAASKAELFVCEAYAFDKAIKYHLSYRTLADHLKAISAKRVILTHLGSDLLGHLDEVAADVAYDGLMVTIDDD